MTLSAAPCRVMAVAGRQWKRGHPSGASDTERVTHYMKSMAISWRERDDYVLHCVSRYRFLQRVYLLFTIYECERVSGFRLLSLSRSVHVYVRPFGRVCIYLSILKERFSLFAYFLQLSLMMMTPSYAKRGSCLQSNPFLTL